MMASFIIFTNLNIPKDLSHIIAIKLSSTILYILIYLFVLRFLKCSFMVAMDTSFHVLKNSSIDIHKADLKYRPNIWWK